MSLKPYEIDRLAHDLVLKFRDKQDKKITMYWVKVTKCEWRLLMD